MRMLCVIFSIMLFSSLAAATVESYEELASALREGKQMTIVLDLQACTGNAAMPIGNFTPQSLMLIPGESEHIATSQLHFTQMQTPRYEYVKYSFFPDNRVTIRAIFYNPATFQQEGKELNFQCALNEGVTVHTHN